MANYRDHINNEAREYLLTRKLQQLAAEGYANGLDASIAEATGNADMKAQAEANVETINTAIEVVEAELDTLHPKEE